MEEKSNGVTHWDISSNVGNHEVLTSIFNTINDGVEISDFSVFSQGFENQTVIPFDDIYFKHAGFDDEREPRHLQRYSQMENAERLECLMNIPFGVFHNTHL
jgi:hypothetical protein